MSNCFGSLFLRAVPFILVLQWATVTAADTSPVVPPASLRNIDLSRSLIALVSFATTPGVKSANYSISWPEDQNKTDLAKSVLELEPVIDLRGQYFKIFGGIGISNIDLKEDVLTQNTDGDTVLIEPRRELLSARLSGGLTFQVTPHIQVTPYLTVILSELNSETTVSGYADLDNIDPALRAYLLDFKVKSTTLAGTLQLKYDRWFGERRIELYGRYTYTYTDTYDESFDFLESSGADEVLGFDARWSGPTGLRIFEVPIRWKLLGGYTTFFDLPAETLGFTYFFEYGAGFDFEMDVRPIGLFNLRSVGLNVSGIVGDHITGWSIGISFGN